MPSGTGANALALSTMVPSFGAVLCHEEAHINVDAPIAGPMGAHQKSSGSARPLPNTTNIPTSTMFDGLNT